MFHIRRMILSERNIRLLTRFKINERHVSTVDGNRGRNKTHPTLSCPYLGSLKTTDRAVQQDDVTKDFYMGIVNGSLASAYEKYGPCYEKAILPPNSDKSVIIVGAGVSGLAAAFELAKVGYKVQVIERQHRVGGRTKTLRNGFSPGLHAEGGAMRIPPNHYLTNGYMDKFKVKLREFTNYNKDTWLYLSDGTKIRTHEWEEDNKIKSDQLFPGWDKIINENNLVADGLLDLHKKTMKPVKDDLFNKIEDKGEHDGWAAWVEEWSKFSVNDYLRSTPDDNKYLPWPEVAIKGYQIATYSPTFDQSLVEYLRDELGEWWRHHLKTPTDGMDTLAKRFIDKHEEENIYLAPKISFGTKVQKINKRGENGVEVIGRNIFTGKESTFEANAVIVTVPLTILRQIDMDISNDHKRATEDIHYGASTKIVLQCRSRFWEKDVGHGGFSKTDLPIGQLHYPSCHNPPSPNERGLLLCYTWAQDALIFGAQSQAEAIDSAVKEITKIHPEMKEEFEVGMVQAWFNDSATQCAYALLRPYQYNNAMRTLMKPDHPIYLAGEAISYTNGWIQGALESGLNAAYHLYSKNNPE